MALICSCSQIVRTLETCVLVIVHAQQSSDSKLLLSAFVKPELISDGVADVTTIGCETG